MKIPVVMKIIFNIVFFLIYSLIFIVFVNFLYGLFMNIMSKPIASYGDPLHTKMAAIVVVFVFIFTYILREYFYISLKKNDYKKVDLDVLDSRNYKKVEKKVINKDKDDLEILVGREKIK